MRLPRLAIVLCAATGGILALGGCSVLGKVTMQHSQALYAKWTDAPTSGGNDTVPPAFVPHDATHLTLRTLNSGHGAILSYVSTEQPDPALCTPGALEGKPRLDANWWPATKPPAEGLVCSPDWRLFEIDGTSYAWSEI
jgi:hypothetical protein